MRNFLLLLFIFITIIPSAQIVNIESARMQTDTTGWMGGAGMRFSLSKSVSRIFTADLDVHLQYKKQKALWLILANHNFLRGGSEKFVSNSLVHLRRNRNLNPWLSWEVFTQLQNNAVTQIDSRYLLGTGPRFKIFSTKIFRLNAASLVMHEWEKERTVPAVKHADWRSSSYITFSITPSENIEFISTSYFQPLIKNFRDYRFSNQSVVRVKFSKHFRVSMRWNYLFDRFPAGTSPQTIYGFSNGFEYDL